MCTWKQRVNEWPPVQNPQNVLFIIILNGDNQQMHNLEKPGNKQMPINFLSNRLIDSFQLYITGFSRWVDLGTACYVWCCKHSGCSADQGASAIASSSFRRSDLAEYLGHPFFFSAEVSFLNTQPTASNGGKRKANSEPQISSSCPR